MLIVPLGIRIVAIRDPFEHGAGARPTGSADERIGAIARREVAFLLTTVGRRPKRHAAAVEDAVCETILKSAASAIFNHLANRFGRPSVACHDWGRRQDLSDAQVPDIDEFRLGA